MVGEGVLPLCTFCDLQLHPNTLLLHRLTVPLPSFFGYLYWRWMVACEDHAIDGGLWFFIRAPHQERSFRQRLAMHNDNFPSMFARS